MGHHNHHHLMHLPSFGRNKEPPKGCMGIRVGQEGEEQQRFVVPLDYLNHPLFVGLLKEAEKEYGFHHKGAISIPCHVEYFRKIQEKIERSNHDTAHHHGHHHHHHHHHFHLAGCFGGLKA